MTISLLIVRDISCHAYHALTLCDVARRARFSILSFVETKYKVNLGQKTKKISRQ